jgi:hypothetical protein
VVLACRFLLDLTVAETADALGLPEGTVKSYTARALARMRELLGGARSWNLAHRRCEVLTDQELIDGLRRELADVQPPIDLSDRLRAQAAEPTSISRRRFRYRSASSRPPRGGNAYPPYW